MDVIEAIRPELRSQHALKADQVKIHLVQICTRAASWCEVALTVGRLLFNLACIVLTLMAFLRIASVALAKARWNRLAIQQALLPQPDVC